MDTTRIGSDLRSSQGDVIIFVESFIAEHESNIQFEIGKVTRIGNVLTVYSQNDFSVFLALIYHATVFRTLAKKNRICH